MNIRLLIIMLLMVAANCVGGELTWKLLKADIRHRLPDVLQMTVAELAATNMQEYVLVDVRKDAEYKVSHLKDAVNLTDVDKIIELIKDKNKKVVVYCSVGYRSAYVAKDLMSRGVTNVYNLEGSIFEWVNLGHTVYDNKGVTVYVHPYNRVWGKLLNKKYRHY